MFKNSITRYIEILDDGTEFEYKDENAFWEAGEDYCRKHGLAKALRRFDIIIESFIDQNNNPLPWSEFIYNKKEV